MANRDDKLARFVKKFDVQMKECLMPVVKPQAEKHGNHKQSDDKKKPPEEKCYCGELIEHHYYELHRAKKDSDTGHSSLPVTGTDASAGGATTQKPILQSETWDQKIAIDKLPTNAVGKIKFLQAEGVRRVSDFIRISDDTDMKLILELFSKHWSLFTPMPSLVISILGGAKNLKMDSKISETFKSGLIMAAKSTNAWIITGGFNCGVMKLVGDAVQEWQGVLFDENGQPREAVRCIGIAPWGYVKNRDSLVAHEAGFRKSKAAARNGLASTMPVESFEEKKPTAKLGGVFDYSPSSSAEHGSTLSLNPNHTHFLLVDNGKRNTFDPKVGDFRAKLENLVSAKNGESLKGLDTSFGIPVVVVLVEGGDDSIKGCAQSIKAGIPVVSCAGTGRAADILAYAIKNCDWHGHSKFNEYVLSQLKDKVYRSYYEKLLTKFFDDPKHMKGEEGEVAKLKKIKEAYREIKSDVLPRLLYLAHLPPVLKKFCNEKIDEIITDVKSCCVNSRLLTAFDCTSDKEDLDYAILAALANKKQTKTPDDLKEQLRLALTWNRSDIAEKDIFAHQNDTFESAIVGDVIFDAILLDRVEFLHVVLGNGIVINDIMTVDKLRRLYKEALADSNRNTPDANHLYRRLKTTARALDSTIQREISHGNIRLCAIHKMLASLIGCKYNSIARTQPQSEEIYDEYTLDSLDIRVEYNLPPEIAHLPLSNPCRELFLFAVVLNRTKMAEFFWRRTDDCLCLALCAVKIFNSLAATCEGHQLDLQNSYLESKKKFEDLACSLINESYKAQSERALILVERHCEIISDTTCLEIGASAQAQTFLSTTCCQEALDALWKQGIRPGAMVTLLGIVCPFIIPALDFEKPGEEDGQLTVGEKLVAFYRAPVTKFLFWHFSFFLYLILYTYVLLFDFSETPSPIEISIYVWTFTLFADSLTEIGNMQGMDPRRKLLRWIRWSVWNPATVISFMLHLAGVICRFMGSSQGDDLLNYRGKVLLASCLFILICRFSRVFSIHSWLGPKLVMIRKMLVELGRWLIILTIFNIAFGVMRSALMFRDDQLANYKTFDNIAYFPFWQLWNMYDITLDPLKEYGCGANDTLTPYGQACPINFELLPIILAAYLIVAKIMLCNLLIAILNNVYGDVQQNSLQVWKYNFFLVAKWAESKLWLPPPIGFFGIFTPWGLFCSWDNNTAQSLYQANHVEQLRIFEREMLVSMAKAASEAHRQTIEGQIKAVRESIGHIVDRVAGLRNLDLIAKRDQDKSATSKRAEFHWRTALKRIASKSTAAEAAEKTHAGSALKQLTRGPDDTSRPSKVSTPPVADAADFGKLDSRIGDLERGFEALEKSLTSTLSEVNTMQHPQ